jgi:predicted Zn-dependent protease
VRSSAALLAIALSGLPAPAGGFSRLPIGEPVPNPELPALDGGRAALLGSARANVFVFFRPGHDHSLQALEQLARLEREFAGKPVRFAAVTSDSYLRDEVRATAREAGIRMPVLVDVGDALYGELGVALHPVIGIADGSHRLAAYEHFRKVNLLDRLRGRIQLLLGEIRPADMERITSPAKATTDSPLALAHRRAQLARMLLDRGRIAKALENAEAAVAAGPDLAEAQAVLARSLAAAGRCAEAERAQARARALGASLAPLPCPVE